MHGARSHGGASAQGRLRRGRQRPVTLALTLHSSFASLDAVSLQRICQRGRVLPQHRKPDVLVTDPGVSQAAVSRTTYDTSQPMTVGHDPKIVSLVPGAEALRGAPTDSQRIVKLSVAAQAWCFIP